jgi:hypothetical protein
MFSHLQDYVLVQLGMRILKHHKRRAQLVQVSQFYLRCIGIGLLELPSGYFGFTEWYKTMAFVVPSLRCHLSLRHPLISNTKQVAFGRPVQGDYVPILYSFSLEKNCWVHQIFKLWFQIFFSCITCWSVSNG